LQLFGNIPHGHRPKIQYSIVLFETTGL